MLIMTQAPATGPTGSSNQRQSRVRWSDQSPGAAQPRVPTQSRSPVPVTVMSPVLVTSAESYSGEVGTCMYIHVYVQ